MTANPLIAHFQMLARYNTLANSKIYNTCATLPQPELHRIRPAFFKTIHGTLNHILIGDRIWLGRFAGEEVPSTGLNAILYPDFEALRQARIEEDARIEAFTQTITEDFLSQTITYRNNAGNIHADRVSLLLAHFFNHQTHHRGQIHDMLSQTELAPPSLDMHRLLRPDPV
ncbi:MAG TPA: damage-inducible protein DinB [Oscillatoriaceae cyanobacterium M33_DOE_052]|uniref:Damage-inducible protein DinB n=1 Tax=Planktothricoides sp. SpSt-374 TaxID=2282167 RepID=A0A7C3ZV35_9CYAN|nr:damage-inducible protein DinB [Oscillatoriaceae cyanobacterium M33_DOE_052]